MKVYKFSVIFLVLVFSFGLLSAESLYDFGSMQKEQSFQVEPGETLTLNLFFFVDEEYGNRITHVKLSESEVPEGWEVVFDPPVHEEYLNISGVITVSNENLYVEPKPVLEEIPAEKEEGVEYLLSPSGKGYLQAKKVQIFVTVPESTPLGESFNLKFVGEAFWFGQSGNIALKQSRPFSYTVSTAKKEYTEQIISKDDLDEESDENPQESELDMNIVIMGLLVVVILVLAYFVFSKKQVQQKPSDMKSKTPTKAKKKSKKRSKKSKKKAKKPKSKKPKRKKKTKRKKSKK